MRNDILKYGFSVGRVHVLEEAMLSNNQVERILETRDLGEKLQILEETLYGEFLETIKSEEDIEQSLNNYLDFFLRLLDELSDETLSSFFKLAYKMKNTESFYSKRLELAKKTSIKLLLLIARIDIDLANIRIWWRNPKKMAEKLIDGGRIDKEIFLTEEAVKIISNTYKPLEKVTQANALLLDKDLDNCILLILREQKYSPISADRLVAFLKAKEIEMKNVRLILFSGLNNFSPDATETNLRYLYA